jgi:bacterioferritin-associated ferredoxin
VYVCVCNELTDRAMHEARRRGAVSAAEVLRQCGAEVQCGRCLSFIDRCLKEDERAGGDCPCR